MDQSEISQSAQTVASVSPGCAPPVAADAPGLAPADADGEASATVTIEIDPAPITALSHWVPPLGDRPRMGDFTGGRERQRTSVPRPWRVPPMVRFAAAIALAVGGGAAAGSLTTWWVTHAPPSDQVAAAGETAQVKLAVERLHSDLVALRSDFEGSNRVASTQFARLSDRIDRAERAQAEPAAKLAKINEALERIDRRTRDIAEPVVALPDQRVSAPVPIKETSRVSVVPGWVVRNVYDGAALIQGRIGMIEVEVGDPLPGGGRVQAIRRQEGRWVVVTTKGLILAAQ
jgi:hypothetical protein